MSWNDITITDAGRTLLAEMINGGKELCLKRQKVRSWLKN